MCKRKTTAQFIEEAKAVHGDRYDYSKVVYRRVRDKVQVICKEHGLFFIFPGNHLRGSGCVRCKKITCTEDFIKKAKKVHGNKYDYSKTKFIRSTQDVVITCKKHGDFYQRISNHIHGSGCNKCKVEKSASDKIEEAKNSFIEKAQKKHGDKYGYNMASYKGVRYDMEIFCNKHQKWFSQRPHNHLRGSGCIDCGKEIAKQKVSKSYEDFMHGALSMHRDKYDYSKFIFRGRTEKGVVICPKHGEFLTTYDIHVRHGCGCPKCGDETSRDKQSMSFDDFVKKATKKHGNIFEYHRDTWVKATSKTKITCKVCNESFERRGGEHLRASGCPVCSGHVVNNDLFTKKSIRVHGDKYGYDAIEYLKSNIPIRIFCRKHKEYFNQTPTTHLGGSGCPKCAIEEKRWNTKRFIKESKLIHGDVFLYPRTRYTGYHNELVVTCKTHGDFQQKPANHLSDRNGCPKCAGRIFENSDFIDKCLSKWGDIYIYPKTIYKGSFEDIVVTCKVHGDFTTSPNRFLSGQGCTLCTSSSGEIAIYLFLLKNKILNYKNYSFASCRYKNKLPFDYYLPGYNILIEYDGVQHYKTVNTNFFGGKEALKKRQKRDAIKTKWAKENGYKLIRIPYWDFDNIEQILKEEILGEKMRFIPKQLLLFT